MTLNNNQPTNKQTRNPTLRMKQTAKCQVSRERQSTSVLFFIFSRRQN